MKLLTYALVFVFGFLSCALFIYGMYFGKEIPSAFGMQSEAESPGDWINEKQIHVYENAIVIDVEDASLSSYALTGSMKPVFDENSNGIRIKPENPEEIKLGDIISYEKDNELIVHRVIEKGEDSEGTYFITKGDNNNVDDGKIRFSQIKYVTIGVLY